MTKEQKEIFSIPKELSSSFLIPRGGTSAKPHHLGMVYKLMTSKYVIDNIHKLSPSDEQSDMIKDSDIHNINSKHILNLETAKITVNMLAVSKEAVTVKQNNCFEQWKMLLVMLEYYIPDTPLDFFVNIIKVVEDDKFVFVIFEDCGDQNLEIILQEREFDEE
jgi:hypothetical protein